MAFGLRRRANWDRASTALVGSQAPLPACRWRLRSAQNANPNYILPGKGRVQIGDDVGQQEMQGLLCTAPAAVVAVAVDDAGQDSVRNKAGVSLSTVQLHTRG